MSQHEFEDYSVDKEFLKKPKKKEKTQRKSVNLLMYFMMKTFIAHVSIWLIFITKLLLILIINFFT